MATPTHPATGQSSDSKMEPRPRGLSSPPLAQAQLGGKLTGLTERGQLLQALVRRKPVSARLETLDLVNIYEGAHQ